MLRPKYCAQVYLYSGIVDMRKSIDGLAALVEQELDLSPMNEALLVTLTSKGPVLYWSDRVGKNNTIFKMPKFRSMKVDAPVVIQNQLRLFKLVEYFSRKNSEK